MSNELAVIEENVGVLMRRATDVAGVCREIVTKTAMNIGGRKHVKVEGWEAIAVAYGCIASSGDVETVGASENGVGGFKAVGSLKRVSDGVVLATAEGFVGEDEPVWCGGIDGAGKKHPRRPEYARRAMAQTRAISRVCRQAFSFVVVMIDEKLSTTPAEEVDSTNDAEQSKAVAAAPPKGAAELKARMNSRPSPPVMEATPFMADPQTGEVARPFAPAELRFGSSKGKTSEQIDDRSVDWYLKVFTESAEDPAKAAFRDSNLANAETLHREREWRKANGVAI